MRYLLIFDDGATPPDRHEAPSGRRLARLLRYALRSCGLKSLVDPCPLPDFLSAAWVRECLRRKLDEREG